MQARVYVVLALALLAQCSVQANRVLLRSLSSDDTATLQPELMATASATPSNRDKVDGDTVVQRFMQIYLTQSGANGTAARTNTTTNTTRDQPVKPGSSAQEPVFYSNKVHIGCGREMPECAYIADPVTKTVPNVTSANACCDLAAQSRQFERWTFNKANNQCQLFNQRFAQLQCSTDAEIASRTNTTQTARREALKLITSGKPDAACRVTYKADWTFSATAFPTKFTIISTFLDNPDERECCARCVYANNCDLFGVDETAQKCTLYSRTARKGDILQSEAPTLAPKANSIAGEFVWA